VRAVVLERGHLTLVGPRQDGLALVEAVSDRKEERRVGGNLRAVGDATVLVHLPVGIQSALFSLLIVTA
jgi:hypothetical protein